MTIPDPKFRVGQVVVIIDYHRFIVIKTKCWSDRWIYGYYEQDGTIKQIPEERIRLVSLEEIR